MEKILVYGGTPLVGSVKVSGSKNAALPIIFATLVTGGVSRLSNLPDITDVNVALKLISYLGARVLREGDIIYIDTRNIYFKHPPKELTSKIRASTYLLGSMIARLGKCPIIDFGGCNFALRPIDLHIYAAEQLGAEVKDGFLTAKKLRPAEIEFKKPSVGATANALIMASSIDGETVIRGHALEPHIISLIDFLRSAGALISVDDSEIRVRGGELHGGSCEIIGDMIEAGTYLSMGIVTEGKVCVSGCDTSQMNSFIEFLKSIGAGVKKESNTITVERRASYPCNRTAAPYPAFPTDLQPIAAVLLASHSGGKIKDEVFPERFGYLDRLLTFGVKYKLFGGEAYVYPSNFNPSKAYAPDLRGGAACLLCALEAHGVSEIYSPEIILRGYERLNEKISSLGGAVEFV